MANARRGSIPAILGCVLCVLVLAGCDGGGGGSGSRHPAPPDPPDTTPVAQLRTALAGLAPDDFLEVSARALLARNPDAMVETGLEEADAAPVLTDLSDAYRAITVEMTAVVLTALDAYDANTLSTAQRLRFAAWRWYLADQVEADRYRLRTYPITASIASLESQTRLFFTDIHPLATERDAERYIARLRLLDARLAQIEALLRARRDAGIVAPRATLSPAGDEIAAIGAASPEQSPYYSGLRTRLLAVDPPVPGQDTLLGQARDVLAAEVLPAYRSLGRLVQQLAQQAPGVPGVSQFAGGADYYAWLLHHHTTTSLDANAVHELGLRELARIHDEMAQRFDALGYPAGESLATSYGRVAADSGFVPANNVVTRFEQIIEETQARLGDAFSRAPAQPIIVIGVASGGFYVAGSIENARPAAFYATVGGNQPAYQMRSLAYHETVPGHHLQIALAQELGLPLYTRLTEFTSFVEGWALYAERLAAEIGWFEGDPYGDLGRLQWEALRASRLVVDSGLHAFGWSFDRTVTEMQTATGFSRGFCEGQVYRYIAMPGQATAYMIGLLRILELREAVRSAQGDAFTLAGFHDLILDRGALPLSVLEQSVAQSLAE